METRSPEWNLREALKLYLVMGMEGYGSRSALDIAREALQGGVTMLQLREKDAPLRDVLEFGRELRELCRSFQVPFIVNDRVDVAVLLDADGVHVGQDDLPGLEARRLLPQGKWIGVSAGSMEEARWAVEQGADYLGVGPIYSTATKLDAGEAVGTALVTELIGAYALPLVGIGGIGPANAAAVVEAGADGIAVVSAITRQEAPEKAATSLLKVVASAIRR